MPDQLTVDQLLALFGRTPDETRRISAADSEEYLSMVTYRLTVPTTDASRDLLCTSVE